LLTDPIEALPSGNYNLTLHNRIRAKQIDNGEAIRAIPDLTVRAIAAMLDAELSVKDISNIIQVSRQAIYKTIQVYTEKASKQTDIKQL
jgi:hypothetical protein